MTRQNKIFLPISSNELGEKKKSALVAEKIFQAIQDKRMAPGAKLPSEREISDQLKVSRTIVREALSALKLVGAISVRAGEGNYISEQPTRANPLHKTVALLEQSESPMAIWEARQALEKTAGELAIVKATARDDELLTEMYEDMVEKGRQGDLDRHLISNRQFHWMFFKIADNPILHRIGEWLMNYADQLITRDATNQFVGKALEQSLDMHKDILRSFLERNVSDFRKAIDYHFKVLEHFYAEDID